MTFYHCSPIGGLKILEPGKPVSFDKPARVYMTTLLPMALLYGVRNFEYTYGYTREGQIYFEEYFSNALVTLYGGKTASLYICHPDKTEQTAIPNEAVSEQSVPILEEIFIPDVYEALLEQERLGVLVIRRYEELPERMLQWVRRVEKETILEKDILHASGPVADYYRSHYPDSCADAQNEQALK